MVAEVNELNGLYQVIKEEVILGVLALGSRQDLWIVGNRDGRSRPSAPGLVDCFRQTWRLNAIDKTVVHHDASTFRARSVPGLRTSDG